MAPLRERFEESEQLRRGAIGAVSGGIAGVTLTLMDGSLVGNLLVAAFVGGVTFVALWLLTS